MSSRRANFFAIAGLAAGALAATAVLVPGRAIARGSPFVTTPSDWRDTRAARYASASPAACLAELDARRFPYERVDARAAPNVETPLRITGPVRSVEFAQTYRPELDKKSLATIADCRLALAIDDLAIVLASHDVVEAQYLSMYRRRRGAPAGRRHPAALAIDLAAVRLRDGTFSTVQYDFLGRIGARTCGERATPPRKDTPGARLWRAIACDLTATRSFNLMLTPNHDHGHRDHFHLEVRTAIPWLLLH